MVIKLLTLKSLGYPNIPKKVLSILLALLALIALKKLIKSLSIYNNIYIIYNNFNYYQKTQHQVIGKISKFNLYTTGKILRGVYMPEGGLK